MSPNSSFETNRNETQNIYFQIIILNFAKICYQFHDIESNKNQTKNI